MCVCACALYLAEANARMHEVRYTRASSPRRTDTHASLMHASVTSAAYSARSLWSTTMLMLCGFGSFTGTLWREELRETSCDRRCGI